MKTAIVTGANSEIGITICKTLLESGYHVIATIHKNSERIDMIKSDDLQVRFLDLTDEAKIASLGIKVDLIVNAAAYYFDDYYQNITKAGFMRVLDVNVVAPFLMFKYLLKDEGMVINISSTDGIDTYNELNITYSASKAALNNLTRSLAYASNAKVYALVLGWVNTEMIRSINQEYLKSEMLRTNQEKLVELDEISTVIKKILNNKYESGTIIRIDGGNNEDKR